MFKYYFIYLVALVSLSQASVIIRWSQVDPLVLGGWRLLFASLILRVFFEFAHSQKEKKSDSLKLKNHKFHILLIGFMFFLHLFSYAYAAHTIPVTYLMLIYSCNPIFTAIGNMFLFKEKIQLKHIFAFMFSFIGIYILVRNQGASIPIGAGQTAEESAISSLGIGSAILAAMTFAVYSVMSKKVRKNLPNSFATSLFYSVSSVFFFVTLLGLGHELVPDYSSRGWFAILLLTIFPTLLGHSIFTFCMNHIDIQVLSIGKLIEPIFAAVSAFIILGEPITFDHFVAFFFISSGISLLFIRFGKKTF